MWFVCLLLFLGILFLGFRIYHVQRRLNFVIAVCDKLLTAQYYGDFDGRKKNHS